MIEIVTDEKLEKYGINMFGESLPPHGSRAIDILLMQLIERDANILAQVFIIPELCGPMGRILK